MREPTPDLAAIKARLQRPGKGAVRSRVVLTVDEAEGVAAALERAEEVADQGCEVCGGEEGGSMVTDFGPEGEPHGHWWLCGECANKVAVETSTMIQGLKRRTAELEAALGEYGGHKQDCWRNMPKHPCTCGWSHKRKALLDQPAAGEKSERG